MISTRISSILNVIFLFLAFVAVCAFVIAIWTAMGIVLHGLLPGIDLGIATIICALAFVFVISVISLASRNSLIASLRDVGVQGEKFDDDDDDDDDEEEWEQEPTRHWNQKTQNRRRAQRRRSRNK